MQVKIKFLICDTLTTVSGDLCDILPPSRNHFV